MKIAYTIFTTSHGNGGHFYSLVTTAKAISEKAEVIIFNLGFNKSPVIESAGIKHYNLILKSKNLNNIYREFNNIVQLENPDVLHSFCTLSFFFVRAYALRNSIKIMLTKCGGPNPKTYFPYAKDLILYSKENYNYFKTKRKFRLSQFYIIPNRVLDVNTDNKRVDELKKHIFDSSAKIFLRIGRITEHYHNSIKQSINLVNTLNEKNQNATLLIVGSLQSKRVLEELKEFCDKNIIIITDPRFTQNASELIEIADFVIGTGRSLMEAASQGKILLTPNNSAQHPILVSNDNAEKLLETNFSPRNKIEIHTEKNISEIIKIITDKTIENEYRTLSETLFSEHFSIKSKLNNYIQIYQKLKVYPVPTIDLLTHYFFIKRYIGKYISKN